MTRRFLGASLRFALLALTLNGSAGVIFTEVAASAMGSFNGNSISGSLADIDNDGDLDVLIQGPYASPPLFRNNWIESGMTTLTFTDVTSAQSPVISDATGWSAAWGDYDGDGDVDVFLGESNPGSASGDLLQNQLVETGLASFENVSATQGLIADPGFHQNVAWSDIDHDGRLDLVIAMEGPEPHEIYLQTAPGSFLQSGASAGIQIPYSGANHGKCYGMAIGDTDGDGDSELYLSTCLGTGTIRNNFFDNQLVESGLTSLTFTDIADSNGTQFMPNSYAAEFHDFDNDGDLDLFMVGADQQASKIWRNDGGGAWTDTDTLRGGPLLSDTGGDYNGGRAIDYDNDGDLDLYFHDHKPFNGRDKARALYRNDGSWNFTEVTLATGLSASNEGGYDSVWGDLDLDGDLDLFFPNDSGQAERLFTSDARQLGSPNNYLMVDLIGPPGNTTGIGAEVYVTPLDGSLAGITLRRDANANAGAFHQSDLPVHFGLGDSTLVDLHVVWPDPAATEGNLTNVSVNQTLVIDYLTVPAEMTVLESD